MKFSKSRYDHFKSRFNYLISKACQSLGDEQEISKEDKVTFIMNKKAKLKEEMLVPDEDGSCSRWLSEFLKFWKYPKEDVITAKNLTLYDKRVQLREKLNQQLFDLLDRFTLELISGEDVMAEIKKLEKKYNIV